jgi:iron complex outermembrane recepter protein
MKPAVRILLLASSLATIGPAAFADAPLDLFDLSLEELMEIEVTSVSKRPQKISQAAAAVAVVTRDDIRRAGITSVPEALRLIPGVQVARFDANKWAISIRGFNNLFSEKLLALIDGRSVYNPMYSGVFWEIQDLLLDDIERIEVIRGPGATLWGANAVNGIVNIITRPAADTQGILVRTGLGIEERSSLSLRYGGGAGDDLHYRLFAKYFDRDAFAYPSGDPADDAWHASRAGFRLDWTPDGQSLSLQGDLYECDQSELLELAKIEPPYAHDSVANPIITGGFLLGRWERVFSDISDLKLQLYYNRTHGNESQLIDGLYEEFDIDFQHRLRYGERQEIIWGGEYRLAWDRLISDFILQFDPPRHTYHLFSSFVQNDLTLVPDRLRVTLGSKFEHNTFSGFEIQPSARLLWTPYQSHTAWGAASRAVRTPVRADHHLRYVRKVLPPGTLAPDTPLTFFMPMGNPDFVAEDVISCELGYRLQPRDRLFFDLATFYSLYDELRIYEPGLPFYAEEPAPPHLVLPLYQNNGIYGATWGGELAVDWLVRNGWRLRAAYSRLHMDMKADPGIQSTSVNDIRGQNPGHQFFLRSSLDLPAGLELDGTLRHVGELTYLELDSYMELDLCLGWRPADRVELFLVGQNLLHAQHPEYSNVAIPFISTEVERSVHAVLMLSF